MTGKSTLKQLAAELDLSVTTVSRALAGYSDVAAATRERILAAADRANYVPNSAGRMLVSGRSGCVGLVLSGEPGKRVDQGTLDPFLGEFIQGLSAGLVERNCDLYLAAPSPQRSPLEVLRRTVESGRVDGVVLTRTSEADERVDYLLQRGIPFICHGRVLQTNQSYSWVDTDGEKAFEEAVDLLHAAGHRHFALLSISDSQTFRHFRVRGVQTAIEKYNDDQVHLITRQVARFEKASWAAVIAGMLTSTPRPTAFLALTDEIALEIIAQAAALDIKVPDQLSVIGFDNIPAARYTTPALTTFDQRIGDSARRVAELLLDAIEKPGADQQLLVRPPLIRRDSHGPAPSTIT